MGKGGGKGAGRGGSNTPVASPENSPRPTPEPELDAAILASTRANRGAFKEAGSGTFKVADDENFKDQSPSRSATPNWLLPPSGSTKRRQAKEHVHVVSHAPPVELVDHKPATSAATDSVPAVAQRPARQAPKKLWRRARASIDLIDDRMPNNTDDLDFFGYASIVWHAGRLSDAGNNSDASAVAGSQLKPDDHVFLQALTTCDPKMLDTFFTGLDDPDFEHRITLVHDTETEKNVPNTYPLLHVVIATRQMELFNVAMSFIPPGFDWNTQLDSRFGASPLHYAVDAKFAEAVNALLTAEHPVDVIDMKGQSPFHWGASRGFADLVQKLFEASPSQVLADQRGRTPLHCTLIYGTHEMRMLEARKHAHDSEHNCAEARLHLSLQRRRQCCLNLLLKTPQAPINALDGAHHTPLLIAVKENNYDLSLLVIKCKPKLHILDNNKQNVLHLAVLHQNPKLISLLLGTNGMDKAINQRDKDGKTPLHLASHRCLHDIATMIMANGASISIQDDEGHTPVHVAVCNEDMKMVKVLLVGGGDKRDELDVKSKAGLTALHMVAAGRDGRLKWNVPAPFVTELLTQTLVKNPQKGSRLSVALEKLAEPTGNDDDDCATSLEHIKQGPKDLQLFKTLVDCHAYVDTSNKLGYNSCHIAAMFDSLEIVEWLVENQPDLIRSKTPVTVYTPLHLSALAGKARASFAIINTCDSSVADAMDAEGKTPKDLARSHVKDVLLSVVLQRNQFDTIAIYYQNKVESTSWHTWHNRNPNQYSEYLESVTKEIRTAFPVIRVVDVPVYSTVFLNPKGPSQSTIPKTLQTPQRLGGFEVTWITAPELELAKLGMTEGGMYCPKDPRSLLGPKSPKFKPTSPKLIYSKLNNGRFPHSKEILNIIRAQIAQLQDRSSGKTQVAQLEPQAPQRVDRYAQFSYTQERMVRKIGGNFNVNQKFASSKGIVGATSTSTFSTTSRGL